MPFTPAPYKVPTIKVEDYQLSDQYPPTMGDTYPFPPEENLWIHTHNAIRGEIYNLREALEELVARLEKNDGKLEEWIVDCLEEVWASHFDFVENHNLQEEVTVGSIAKPRFRWPEDVSSTHEDLENLLHNIDAQVKQMRKMVGTNSALGSTKKLLETFAEYEKEMLEHLDFEEENLIPLVRAYLSHADMTGLIFKMLRNIPKNEVGSIIHFTGEDHIRNVSLKFQGVPDFLWPFFFQPALDKYRCTIVAGTEAIRTGTPPPEVAKEESICSKFCDWFTRPVFGVLRMVNQDTDEKKSV